MNRTSTKDLLLGNSAQKRASFTLLWLSLVVGSLSACKAGQVRVPEGASQSWDTMDFEQRSAHMYDVVEPRMAEIFQEIDPERFADFECSSCHGQGDSEGHYRMPNPDLPTIDPAHMYKKHRKATPEMTHFMWKVVEPEMANLLGKSHGSKGAINCATCHVLEPSS